MTALFRQQSIASFRDSLGVSLWIHHQHGIYVLHINYSHLICLSHYELYLGNFGL